MLNIYNQTFNYSAFKCIKIHAITPCTTNITCLHQVALINSTYRHFCSSDMNFAKNQQATPCDPLLIYPESLTTIAWLFSHNLTGTETDTVEQRNTCSQNSNSHRLWLGRGNAHSNYVILHTRQSTQTMSSFPPDKYSTLSLFLTD